jgi:hypothetical protein
MTFDGTLLEIGASGGTSGNIVNVIGASGTVFTLTGDIGTNGNILSVGQIQGNPAFSVNSNGTYYINTITSLVNTAISPSLLIGFDISSGNYHAAYFDYHIDDEISSFRAGTVMAAWNAAGGVRWTDTSTPDAAGTTGTSEVSFTVVNVGGTGISLYSNVTGTSDWIIKIGARLI